MILYDIFVQRCQAAIEHFQRMIGQARGREVLQASERIAGYQEQMERSNAFIERNRVAGATEPTVEEVDNMTAYLKKLQRRLAEVIEAKDMTPVGGCRVSSLIWRMQWLSRTLFTDCGVYVHIKRERVKERAIERRRLLGWPDERKKDPASSLRTSGGGGGSSGSRFDLTIEPMRAVVVAHVLPLLRDPWDSPILCELGALACVSTGGTYICRNI